MEPGITHSRVVTMLGAGGQGIDVRLLIEVNLFFPKASIKEK
jgi:hypothetical protein